MVSDITKLEQNKVFSIKGKAVNWTSKLAVETTHFLTLDHRGQLPERKKLDETEI